MPRRDAAHISWRRPCVSLSESAWRRRLARRDQGAVVVRNKATRSTFALIERTAGPTDVLVNNACLVIHAAPEDMTFIDWQKVVEVNLTGQVLAAQQAGRQMIAAGRGGAIINLASIAGLAALERGDLRRLV